MPDQSHSRLNDITLHQLKRQPTDPNITFLGGIVPMQVEMQDGGRMFQPQIAIWIARHSVVPDQPQVRAVMLITQPDDAALLNALVEAILPNANPNMAPMMPGRIEVADATIARALRTALEDVPVEIAVAQDMTIIETLAMTLASDLRRHLTPIPPWDAPQEVIRELAAAAANLFRRDPWQIMEDVPPVAVTIKRYGIDTLYLSMTYGNEDTEGVVAYFSQADFQHAGKIAFLLEQLEEAGGEVINLDLPDDEIALVDDAIHYPEHGLGDAITLFFEPLENLNEEMVRESRALRLPMASKQAVPIFTRVGRTGDARRPNANEARALRLALDAFNQFIVRQRERIEDEGWHFGPLTATIQVKDGTEKVPVRVQMVSLAPTLDPALRNAILKLRVILEDDVTVWREIEIEATQSLWELDQIIQTSFGWPHRTSIFMAKDIHDGEETYETRTIEDIITSETAPIGLLINQPRDFAHFIFDVRDRGLSHRLRLISIGKKEADVEYPRVVRSHGETPPIYSPDEYEADELDDDDDDDFDLEDDDDDDE
jgi:hypothetical protein